MIPYIIHQTWKTAHLPPRLQAWQASWSRLNPRAKYCFYDDAACLDFVRQACAQYLEAYLRYPPGVQRADFFRLLVIYCCGGLYADIDMLCLRPMERFFTLQGAVFSIETQVTRLRQQELGYAWPYQVANCIFAAEPRHPFLAQLVEKAAAQSGGSDRASTEVEEIAGPRWLTRQVQSLRAPGKLVYLLPQIYWMAPTLYPNLWPMNIHMYARHYFWGSWKAPGEHKMPLARRWIERSLPPNPWPKGRRLP